MDNVAANVLSNDPELYWHARYPAKQDWFVLDLGMAIKLLVGLMGEIMDDETWEMAKRA